LIHDGRKQLIVYGEVQCVDQDPQRAELTERVFQVLTDDPNFKSDEAFIKMMDNEQRTIFRITPTKILLNE